MSKTTTTARNAFLNAVSGEIRAITDETWVKAPWVAGVEMMGLAIKFADLDVSPETIRSQIKVARTLFARDGHNWNSYKKAYAENFVDFCLYLLEKKGASEY
jgi:hypothetical protein